MSKVMISMPQELLQELDEAAKERHKRRSELLRDLVVEFLRGPAGHYKDKDPFERLREFKLKLGPGETAEGLIRKMRDSR